MMHMLGLQRYARLLFAMGFLAPALVCAADLLSNQEAAQLLGRMAHAPQELSYQGVYIHQRGDLIEAMRVVHIRDGNFDAERRESLDGPPREYLRQGDQVSIYTPDNSTISLDRHHLAKLFPRQLPDQAEQVLAGYQIRAVGRERVAGFETDIYDFEPKDKLRFQHRFWVQPETGLTLKAAMLGARRELLEMQVFSQIQIGGDISRKLLRSAHPLKPVQVESGQTMPAASSRQWDVKSAPAGFVLIKQMQRPMPGRDKPVTHQLYSDGLVVVSIFIEPFDNREPVGITVQGGMSVFARQAGPYLLTALGEVPPETVQLFSSLYQFKDK